MNGADAASIPDRHSHVAGPGKNDGGHRHIVGGDCCCPGEVNISWKPHQQGQGSGRSGA